MSVENSVVSVFNTHQEAEAAIKELKNQDLIYKSYPSWAKTIKRMST